MPHDPRRQLMWIGLASTVVTAAIAVLSRQFDLAVPSAARPHLWMLGLWGLLFALYLPALRTAITIADDRGLLRIIVGFAIAFRLLLLATTPIQEIDLYRYLWDGNVAAGGVSPYRFAPQTIIDAADRSQPVPFEPTEIEPRRPPAEQTGELQQLVDLSQRSPALSRILRTVHYGDLPTPYPPVSQAVFAAAAMTTPDAAPITTHLTVMKAWLVLFDLLALAAMIGLLRACGVHAGWSVAYAWCPLVLKEFANSGHLDAIAVCLMTAALWQLTRVAVALGVTSQAELPPPTVQIDVDSLNRSPTARSASPGTGRSARPTVAAALLLGLAVGAKLFPILLLPIVGVWLWKHAGWRRSAAFVVVTGLVSAASLWPMFPAGETSEGSKAVSNAPPLPPPPTETYDSLPPVPDETTPALTPPAPTSGLSAFLTRWRMNDLLFLVVSENLDPSRPRSQQPWFVVVPEDVRRTVVSPIAERLDVSLGNAAFLLARVLTLAAFAAIVLWLCGRIVRSGDEAGVERVSLRASFFRGAKDDHAQQKARQPSAAGLVGMLEACFLTLAWFWLLAPTQNPWYWTWCLPLIPFARSRAWLWVSGLTLLYYLRFWLNAHWPESPGPLGTSLSGASFFDFVVVFGEHGLLFVGLLLGCLLRGGGRQQ